MAAIGKQTVVFAISNNCIIMHAYGKKNSVDGPVCRGGTQMWRRDLWIRQGKEKGRRTERVAWMYRCHHTCNRQLARGCCIPQEWSSALCDDRVGGIEDAREAQERGGLSIPTADSLSCKAEKLTQPCKAITLQ